MNDYKTLKKMLLNFIVMTVIFIVWLILFAASIPYDSPDSLKTAFVVLSVIFALILLGLTITNIVFSSILKDRKWGKFFTYISIINLICLGFASFFMIFYVKAIMKEVKNEGYIREMGDGVDNPPYHRPTDPSLF